MAKLTRSNTNRVIGGVCGGVAEHFEWDPTMVRIVFVVAAILGSAGIWIYLAAWAVIPAQDGSSGVKQARQMWDDSRGKRNNQSGSNFDPYND